MAEISSMLIADGSLPSRLPKQLSLASVVAPVRITRLPLVCFQERVSIPLRTCSDAPAEVGQLSTRRSSDSLGGPNFSEIWTTTVVMSTLSLRHRSVIKASLPPSNVREDSIGSLRHGVMTVALNFSVPAGVLENASSGTSSIGAARCTPLLGSARTWALVSPI